MEIKDNWLNSIQKYSLIKELYIECEETDPELNTNLQPLNEFRAALDHIMKLMTSYYLIDDEPNEKEDLEKEVKLQFDKLNSHLNRCFYDVGDMLSINIRNKVIDILEPFSPDEITKAIPNYYSEIRPHMEKVSQNIAKYRYQKGNLGVDSTDRFNQYKNDILKLKEYYEIVLEKMPSLEEVALKEKSIERKNNRYQWILVIGGAIIGGLITFLIG